MAFRSFLQEESPAARFLCLAATFERLIHFLATVVVSAYFRSGAADTECNRHLLEHLLMEKRTTGQLWALLRDTLRLAGDCAGLLPYPELARYLHTPKGGRDGVAEGPASAGRGAEQDVGPRHRPRRRLLRAAASGERSPS